VLKLKIKETVEFTKAISAAMPFMMNERDGKISEEK